MITLSGYTLRCWDMVESRYNLMGCSMAFWNWMINLHTNSAVSSKLKTSRSRIGALCDCKPIRASNSGNKFVRFTPAIGCGGGDGGKRQRKFWDAFLMTYLPLCILWSNIPGIATVTSLHSPSTKSAVVDKPRRLDLNLAIDCYAVNTIRCKRLALLIIFHGTVFNKIGVGLLKNDFVLSNELMI